MSSEGNRVSKSHNTAGSASAIVLAVGPGAVIVGAAIFLLAALPVAPIGFTQNDLFLSYSLLGEGLILVGALLIAGGLIGLRIVHWLVALCVLLVGGFAAYGFRWPDWLLLPVTSPFRPFVGQFTFGGLMLLLFLGTLFTRWQRIWPRLWRPLLISGIVAAVGIALIAWQYAHM
jgi:hypothetical protein